MSRVGEIPAFDEIIDVAQSRGADSEAPDLWNGAVGLWPIAAGGGLKAFDVSGYGNHGTLTNMDPATDWVLDPVHGWVLDVNGTNQAAVAPDSDTLTLPSDFTIAFWTKPASTDAARVVLAKYQVAPSTNGFRINQKAAADGRWSWAVYVGGVGVGENSNAAPTGDWQHLVLTRRGGLCEFFVDAAKQANTDTLAGSIDSSESLYYGTDRSLTNDYVGQLASLLIARRALTPSEIQQLYSDPWAMYRFRSEVFPAAVAGVVVPWHLLIQGAA